MSISKYEIGLMKQFIEKSAGTLPGLSNLSQQDVALPFTDSQEHDERQAKDLFRLISDAANVQLAELQDSGDFSRGSPPKKIQDKGIGFKDGEFGFSVATQRSQIEEFIALEIEDGHLEKSTTVEMFVKDNPTWANSLQIFLQTNDHETVKDTFEQHINESMEAG